MTAPATLTDEELDEIERRARDPISRLGTTGIFFADADKIADAAAMARRTAEAEAKALSHKLFGHVKYAPYCDKAVQLFCDSTIEDVRSLAIELVQTREERDAAEATIAQLREQRATLREALGPMLSWHNDPADRPTEDDCRRAADALAATAPEPREGGR